MTQANQNSAMQPGDEDHSRSESGSAMSEVTEHLLLLYWSGELTSEETKQVEAIVRSSKQARQYLEELAEIESAFACVSAESSERCLVSAALQVVEGSGSQAETGLTSQAPQKESRQTEKVVLPPGVKQDSARRPAAWGRSIGWVSTVALLLLVVVTVMNWSRPNWLGTNPGLESLATHDVGNSQTTIDASPFLAVIELSQTDSSVKKGGGQRFAKSRVQIQVGSKMLAKIQNTRTKLKSFRRRMEKRS